MTLLLLAGCVQPGSFSGVTPTPPHEDTVAEAETASPEDTAQPIGARTLPPLGGGAELYRFAVIGDFGDGSKESHEVAALVARLEADFIITVGDNNYPNGEADTIDENVGQLYHDWIGSYKGKYGKGSEENRFWPCPGNHDWYSKDGLTPYTDYFTLPGNERYYEFRHEDIHFFCVDSDTHEPDGTSPSSIQGQWLETAMRGSDAPVKIVYMHHPPFSSGSHGDNMWMHWPFLAWGADMVFGGHDHIYERQVHDGVPFIVSGIGGYRTYTVRDPTAYSQVAYSKNYGATLVRVFPESMLVETWTIEDGLLDRLRIRPDQPLTDSPRLLYPDDVWTFTTEEPEGDWTAPDFDDSGWSVGTPQGEQVWARSRFAGRPGLDSLTLELQAAGTTELTLNGVPLAGEISGAMSLLDLSAAALVEDSNLLTLHSEGSQSARILVSLWGSGGSTLIPAGAEWRYTTEPPAASWIRPGFDDSAWQTLAAPLSWSSTVTDTASPPPDTVWLRHTFTVDDPDSVRDLLLAQARSDASVVYLNGREVHRAGLPDGVLPAGTRAITPVEADWVTAPATTLVEPQLLVAGDNELAVVVYTAETSSTGLYLDLSLTGL
jgi:hypothetical protein